MQLVVYSQLFMSQQLKAEPKWGKNREIREIVSGTLLCNVFVVKFLTRNLQHLQPAFGALGRWSAKLRSKYHVEKNILKLLFQLRGKREKLSAVTPQVTDAVLITRSCRVVLSGRGIGFCSSDQVTEPGPRK